MTTGDDVVRRFLPASPFAKLLGMRLERVEPDLVVIVMPFEEKLVTMGDVVHGGAISALIDTAATAAAWSAADLSASPRGTTIGMTVSFIAAARARDVTATARVLRRGATICFCEVDVVDSEGRQVARGLVTYKLG